MGKVPGFLAPKGKSLGSPRRALSSRLNWQVTERDGGSVEGGCDRVDCEGPWLRRVWLSPALKLNKPTTKGIGK